jgi:hypothetical protein
MEYTLKDTIELMNSDDYKDRFKAEYYQLKIRYNRLKDFNNRIEAAYRSPVIEMPKHDCPRELLKEQQTIMGEYLKYLEVRALFEQIEL